MCATHRDAGGECEARRGSILGAAQAGALLQRSDDHTGLTSNRCSADDITDLLARHRHALIRYLKCRGVGTRGIAYGIRFENARRLLQDTQVPPARSRRRWANARPASSAELSGASRATRQPRGRPKAATADASLLPLTCCSQILRSVPGTGLTLAVFPHCWDERTFVQACGAIGCCQGRIRAPAPDHFQTALGSRWSGLFVPGSTTTPSGASCPGWGSPSLGQDGRRNSCIATAHQPSSWPFSPAS
jgi:hypothetical protein